MSQPDLDDVIQKTMDIFQAQFPAKLAAVDARKTTPLFPKEPQQWIFGDIIQTPILPCMVFTSHKTGTNEDEFQWRKQTYQLEIEAYATADSVQNLSRIVRRYGAAIDDTLRANQTLGGLAKNITNISQDYWDTMKNETGLFQVVRVTFDVRVLTD